MPGYDFSKKVALVTGAGSGMGRATALAFAGAGAAVVAVDVTGSAAAGTEEEISAAGGQAHAVTADVSRRADVEAAVAAAVETFGRLDVAMNAAAIDIEDVPLAETRESTFDQVIGVNLKGPFLCMQAEIAQMLRQGGGGAIVNVVSVAAFRTKGNNIPAYVASKAGLVGLTRIAAMRYARDKIRINAIAPGAIDTPMLAQSLTRMGVSAEELAASYGAMGRIGRPEEIADAALWLCSNQSSYTVGAVLPVDGGALSG